MRTKLTKLVIACLLSASTVLSAYADGTINVSTGQGDGTGWSFSNKKIYIESLGDYTLTGVTNANSVTINYLKGVNVTLRDLTISADCPINISPGASVNLTLDGTNTLTGAIEQAGLGVSVSASVIIDGSGSLTATGGREAAGIGSGKNANAGAVTINGGTITAISTYKGAGIGGGYHGIAGTVTVNGGVVTATAKEGGSGIGHYNGSGGNLYMKGNSVVFVSSLADTNESHRTGGILFIGNSGTFYGTSITPTENLTIGAGKIFDIAEGYTLTIAQGNTLTTDGTLTVDGSLDINGTAINNGTLTVNSSATVNGSLTNVGSLIIYGSLTNNGEIRNKGTIDGVIVGNPVFVEEYSINLTTVTAGDEGYTFDDNVLTLTSPDATYILTGETQTKRVWVATGISVKVTFNNLNITSSAAAFSINSTSKVKLTLEGVNTLTSGDNYAGLGVPTGATVSIEGNGSLTTTGIGNGGLIAVNEGLVTTTADKGINGTLSMDGNAVLFASSVSDNSAKTKGILFVGNVGTTYGINVAPTVNFTIGAGQTLTVDGGKKLTIPVGKRLTNNGTINVYGGLVINGNITNNGDIFDFGTIEGTVSGNPVTNGQRETYSIDINTVNAGGEGYTFNSNTLTLTGNNANYILTGTSATKRVAVASGISINITLQDVSITANRAFYINSRSTVNLTIEGINQLTSTAEGQAGLGVPENAKVIIGGSGSLTASGNGGSSAGGAGIGSESNIKAGSITINSGTITAIGNKKAAGIGGGYHAGYQEIAINGGFVTATGVSWVSTEGDGIGGYGDGIPTDLFTMDGNAVVIASSVRDNSPKKSGLIFNGALGNFYGDEVRFDRSIIFPDGGSLTVKTGQTLIIEENDTITLPTSVVLTIDNGATIINNGVIKAYKERSIIRNGTITGSGKIIILSADYDNRDRLYFTFHVLKKVIYDNSVEKTMTDAQVNGIHDAVVAFETFLESHSPNVNVVTKTIDYEDQRRAQGTGNDNYFEGTVPLDNYAMDAIIALPTGSPSYAAYYAGSYIHMMPGWAPPVLMHEYAHHIQSLITNYNPDDGQPWENLYLRYDTMPGNQWARLVRDVGEVWDGDNEWLYEDSKTQREPENIVFPAFVSLDLGKDLSKATFSGESGTGIFSFANSTYVPSESQNGNLFRMVFTPTDRTNYHLLIQDVQVRFNGILLTTTISVSQGDITLPEIPNPLIVIYPAGLPTITEYKVQGASNDTYTTAVPTTEGKYTVKVTFAGDNNYGQVSKMVNFTINKMTAISTPEASKNQIKITSGNGFIRVNVESGRATSQLRIYTLTGSLYAMKYISVGETIIPASRGIYIVNIEGTRKKVIVI
jgi:hypothetical protein